MSTIPMNYAIDKQTGLPFFPITHLKAVRDDEGNPLIDLLDDKSIGYGTCSTAAATAAKAVTVSDIIFGTGKTICVKFTNGISVANATLAVTYTDADNVSQTTSAIPIYYRGAALGANLVKAGESIFLNYNGTQLDVIGDLTPSGFNITSDEETGYDEFEAYGNATITEDNTNGYDEFDF